MNSVSGPQIPLFCSISLAAPPELLLAGRGIGLKRRLSEWRDVEFNKGQTYMNEQVYLQKKKKKKRSARLYRGQLKKKYLISIFILKDREKNSFTGKK